MPRREWTAEDEAAEAEGAALLASFQAIGRRTRASGALGKKQTCERRAKQQTVYTRKSADRIANYR